MTCCRGSDGEMVEEGKEKTVEVEELREVTIAEEVVARRWKKEKK